MIKNYFVALLAFVSISVFGQSRVIDSDKTSFWSIGFESGGMFLTNTQYTKTDFNEYRLPLAGQVYVQYNFNELLGLKGSFFTGTSSGSDGSSFFYEGFYGLTDVRLTFNALALISKNYNGRSRLTIDAGLGGLMFHTNMINRSNEISRPNIIVGSSTDGCSTCISATFINGLRFSTAIYSDLDINIGTQMMMTLGNPWLDAFKEGDKQSIFALMPFVGLSYNLRHVAGKKQVVLDREKYNALNNNISELNQTLSEERLTREMMSEDHNAMSIALQREMDVLLKEIDSLQLMLEQGAQFAIKKPIETKKAEQKAILTEQNEVKWRVVIGSFPSQELASKYVNRTQLNKEQIQILYSEKQDTYRVIFSSFDTLDEAIASRNSVKKEIPDAWIIKL